MGFGYQERGRVAAALAPLAHAEATGDSVADLPFRVATSVSEVAEAHGNRTHPPYGSRTAQRF